jgi:hypothetical protein
MQPNHNPFQTPGSGFNPQPMQDIGPARPAAPAPPPVQQTVPQPIMPQPSQAPAFTPPMPQPQQPTPAPMMPTQPAPAPAMNPIAATPDQAPSASSQIAVSARPEIVQSIPVRMPNMSPAQTTPSAPGTLPSTEPQIPAQPLAANPFAATTPAAAAQDPEDSRIEQILQDVNSAVKKPEAPQAAKAGPAAKVAPLKDKVKGAAANPKPKMLVALAVITCISLSLAAYYAFHQTKTVAIRTGPAYKLVGTSANSGASIKAGGGTLVTPSDIEDFSKISQSQLDKLNDSGE